MEGKRIREIEARFGIQAAVIRREEIPQVFRIEGNGWRTTINIVVHESGTHGPNVSKRKNIPQGERVIYDIANGIGLRVNYKKGQKDNGVGLIEDADVLRLAGPNSRNALSRHKIGRGAGYGGIIFIED